MSQGVWAERAWAVIDELHPTLPEGISLAERKKALIAAYPFGARTGFPYKAWCKAQRKYLSRWAPPKPIPENMLALFNWMPLPPPPEQAQERNTR
jgi:hypothetical protein